MMIPNIRKRMQNVPEFGADDMLRYIGLERRRGFFAATLPAVGAMAVGMLAGAGLALLFAPRPGKELRADIERKLIDMRDRRLPQLVDQALGQIRHAEAEMLPRDAFARSNHSTPG
jgi:hypothetical protein